GTAAVDGAQVRYQDLVVLQANVAFRFVYQAASRQQERSGREPAVELGQLHRRVEAQVAAQGGEAGEAGRASRDPGEKIDGRAGLDSAFALTESATGAGHDAQLTRAQLDPL